MKKIVQFIAFTLLTSYSFAQISDATLNTSANTIKNETSSHTNTATRVGTMLNNIIDNKINNDKIATSTSLGTSNTLVPSQAAVKSYVDAIAKVDSIYKNTGGDSIIYTISGRRNAIKDSVGSGGSSAPYKLYAAMLNQSDMAAPVATVLHSDLSGTVVWSRAGQGSFLGTLSSAFTNNKTAGLITQGSNGGVQFQIYTLDADIIELDQITYAGSPQDGLSNAYIEIKVYN